VGISKRYREGFFLHKMFPQKVFPTHKNNANFLQFIWDVYEIAKRVFPAQNVSAKGFSNP